MSDQQVVERDEAEELGEAREKLAALPRWIKVLMWMQTMLCAVMLICLGGVFAVQQDQFVAFYNVAATLLQRTPDMVEQSGLRSAVEIGTAGRQWSYGLIAAIAASATIGGFVVGLMPMKQRKG